MADLTAVLDKVNAARVALGSSPLPDIPRGVRSSPTDCPLARAFKGVSPGVAVGGCSVSGLGRSRAYAFAAAVGGTVIDINGTATVSTPREFGQFVSDFDSGRYPQYSV